jgi:hypothetical protein
VDIKPEDESYRYALQIVFALKDAGIAADIRPLTQEFDRVPIPTSGTMVFFRQGDADFKALSGVLAETFLRTLIAQSMSTPEASNIQYAPLPSPSLIVRPKQMPFWWFWDDPGMKFDRPADWKGEWPPRPPWEPK